MAKDHGPPVGGGAHRRRGQPACRGPGGTQQIEVVLDIDADGVLNLFTPDRETGAQQATIAENSYFDRIDEEVIPKQAARAHGGAPQEVMA
jgi:molecular chaperone DnaK (HSP70)